MTATLKDIARESGLSYPTVQRALRYPDGGGLKPRTFQRVKEVATRLQYRPNAAARSLVQQSSPYIGILMGSGTTTPAKIPTADLMRCFTDLLVELGIALEERDYHLVLSHVAPTILQEPQTDLPAPKLLQEHHVSGILALNWIWPSLYQEVTRCGLPCVAVLADPLPGIPTLGLDYVQAAALATQHLIDLGHRRIAFLAEAGQTARREPMTLGYLTTLNRAGLSPVSGWDRNADPLKTPLELLSRPEAPTAFLIYDDLSAPALIDTLRQCGFRVPQDISIVSLQDLGFGKLLFPAVTACSVSWKSLAEQSIDKLLTLIQGREVETLHENLKPQLNRRSSSGPIFRPH
jgi:LacI family transcriptional regulator